MTRKLQQNLSTAQQYQLQRLKNATPTVAILLNQNLHTLVSLRQQKDKRFHLSVHHKLFDYPDGICDLIRFANKQLQNPTRRGGCHQATYPQLNAAMHDVATIQRAALATTETTATTADHTLDAEQLETIKQLPCIGRSFDFLESYKNIHRHYFPELSLPLLQWARHSAAKRLRSMRFAAYHHSHPPHTPYPHISLNPRLTYPWIATAFIEHIFHHELCHHKQAAQPIRGEKSHSPRFKAWESSYEQYDNARAWERIHLPKLLDDPRNVQH